MKKLKFTSKGKKLYKHVHHLFDKTDMAFSDLEERYQDVAFLWIMINETVLENKLKDIKSYALQYDELKEYSSTSVNEAINKGLKAGNIILLNIE